MIDDSLYDATDGGDQSAGTAPGPPPADGKPVDPKTAAFIKRWTGKIKAAKDKHKDTFKQMDECVQLAKDGGTKDWMQSDRNYVVPILVRLTNQSVSQLYAKNPTAVAKRKHRRMFTVWDGQIESLTAAKTSVQGALQGGILPDPNALQIVEDAENVKAYDTMMDGLADTLTILYEHFINEQSAQYKQQFKALVRRVKVCSVGYVKLGFQRILAIDPDITTKIDEATQKIATLQQLLSAEARDKTDEESADAEELRTLVASMQNAGPTLIVKEGPVYSFPRAKSIIIDPACQHLKTLAGAMWIAEEFDKTPDEIEEIWKVDVSGAYTTYKDRSDKWSKWVEVIDGKSEEQAQAKVWRVQDRKTGQVFVICDGHNDYLQAPADPEVKLNRFYDVFPLVFNEIESDEDLYPPSDVWLARHPQAEYNRAREGMREHRQQNRPAYVAGSGSFEESDLDKLASHTSGEIILLNQLNAGEKIADKLQAKPVMKIDPAVYDTKAIWNDILMITGSQQANAGPTTDATATESSIAEQSRTVSLADSADDIDDMLSVLAAATGELMLYELSKETVQAIVGPGAVWPEMPESRQDICESISLSTRAGSSGRPNQAADLAKMERAMPFVLQLPGMNPTPWAQKFADLLDVDLEDAVVQGLPAIASLNAMMQATATKQAQGGQPAGPGDPAQQPGAQGPQGANNAPQPPGTPPGPQAPGGQIMHFNAEGNPHQ